MKRLFKMFYLWIASSFLDALVTSLELFEWLPIIKWLFIVALTPILFVLYSPIELYFIIDATIYQRKQTN